MYQACRFGREIAKSIPSELSMLQKCTERKGNADVGIDFHEAPVKFP